MAWKRHRPSALRTIFKSKYIGALISLLTALVVGAVYVMVTALSYKTVHNCQFLPISLSRRGVRKLPQGVDSLFQNSPPPPPESVQAGTYADVTTKISLNDRLPNLLAEFALISMLSESTAIVAVNGYLYLYQFI